jgi:hypothetical protein
MKAANSVAASLRKSATLTRLESDRHVYQRRSYSAGKHEQE